MFDLTREGRGRALLIVLAAHGLALWLVLSLTHMSFIRDREIVVEVFDVPPAAPPPPAEAPAVVKALSSPAPDRPTPVPVRSPAPLPAPVPIVRTDATQAAPPAGGAERQGEGDGSGAEGSGGGAGTGGPGTGGRRPAVAPRHRTGQIFPRDYPRAAGGQQGIVLAHVAVGADGQVTGCAIARSSGNAILDATTCRLIRERFRFTPARNAQGEAVPGEFGWQQRWWRD